jgi:hypothetical protein
VSPVVVVAAVPVAIEGVRLVVSGLVAAERAGIASAESVFGVSETVTGSVELHQLHGKFLFGFLQDFQKVANLKITNKFTK